MVSRAGTAANAARTPRSRQSRSYSRFRQYGQLYLLLLPAFIYVAIFCYGPMYGLQIAFKNYKMSLGIAGSPWIGMRNFKDFFGGYYFPTLMKNTFTLSLLALVFSFPAPILVALILNELKDRPKRVVQTVLYAPHFISTVVLVGMINVMFSPSMGIVNTLLKSLGMEPRYFLGDPNCFRPLYIGSGIWQSVGYSSILYLASISGINQELYESAILDGASRLKQMIYITLPCIAPTIQIMFIFAIGGILGNDFQKILLMYSETNYETADVISTYVYRRGLIGGQYSYSAAVGLLTSVFSFALIWITNTVNRKVGAESFF